MSRSARISDLGELLGAEIVGDGNHEIEGARSLDSAEQEHLSFLHNPKYVEEALSSRAGAILVADASLLPGRNLLVCPEPYLALAHALEYFYPSEVPSPGVHSSAVVAEDVELGKDASVGPLAYVGAGSSIGAGSAIGPGCVLGVDVVVGADSVLHPRVVVEDGCRIGDHCVIHSGTVIGADGFGFATVDGKHHKVPQVGIVVLEDDVELGSNVCVDRAALGETRIGRGTKVDNLVQIAHNVQIGEGCLLVAQSGISGSTKIGHHSVIAGQAGCVGHIDIGNGVVLAARAVATKDVPDGVMLSGHPGRPHREWLKTNANIQRLDGLRQQVKELEARLSDLEESKR